MKRMLQGLVVVCLLASAVTPANAVGPDDGIWTFLLSNPTAGEVTFFASFHQNGPSVIIVLLSANGTYLACFCGRSLDVIAGDVIYPDGFPFGRLLLQFRSNNVFSGVLSISDTVFSLEGGKLF